jgi:hypothetical protein
MTRCSGKATPSRESPRRGGAAELAGPINVPGDRVEIVHGSLRSQDAEFVVDARLLRETMGCRVDPSLEDTLAELLTERKGHRV